MRQSPSVSPASPSVRLPNASRQEENPMTLCWQSAKL